MKGVHMTATATGQEACEQARARVQALTDELAAITKRQATERAAIESELANASTALRDGGAPDLLATASARLRLEAFDKAVERIQADITAAREDLRTAEASLAVTNAADLEARNRREAIDARAIVLELRTTLKACDDDTRQKTEATLGPILSRLAQIDDLGRAEWLIYQHECLETDYGAARELARETSESVGGKVRTKKLKQRSLTRGNPALFEANERLKIAKAARNKAQELGEQCRDVADRLDYALTQQVSDARGLDINSLDSGTRSSWLHVLTTAQARLEARLVTVHEQESLEGRHGGTRRVMELNQERGQLLATLGLAQQALGKLASSKAA